MQGMGRRLRLPRREVGEMASGRVLEVGIGTGLSLPHYPTDGRVTSVTGVDLSAGMLELCRRRADELSPALAVDVLLADAQALPLPAAGFDTVVFNLCLCTIPDPARAIAEGLRCARPGARMIFLEHVRSRILPVALLQELVNPVMVWLQGDHFTRRTEELIESAGIRIDRVDRWLLGVFVLVVATAPIDPAKSGG